MKKLKCFLYQTNKKETLLLIKTKKRPSAETIPQSGAWVVREYINGEWQMPCFPEIVWGTLRKFKYIGELMNG